MTCFGTLLNKEGPVEEMTLCCSVFMGCDPALKRRRTVQGPSLIGNVKVVWAQLVVYSSYCADYVSLAAVLEGIAFQFFKAVLIIKSVTPLILLVNVLWDYSIFEMFCMRIP